ncbi:glycosyltransferase [Nostoc sp. UHCC 0302]|uniref:glycosyltransferase family 2 protein n=1 Tax=Nostoc sp. UHCC 0302 TaxID=3134896 RepID=UPI00311C95D5
MAKVSVIIPADNAINYLQATLKSVLQQTFIDFEVLIVGDDSTDNLIEWANLLVDPRVKLIFHKDQGIVAARNTGIAEAQGEYIAFLDTDDLWESTKLEKQVKYLEDNPKIGLVHTNIVLLNWQDKPSDRVTTSNAEGDALKQLLEQNAVMTSSVMVRHSCLKCVGEFDINLRSSQDWAMWVQIAARYPCAVIKEPLVYYRERTNNPKKNWQILEQDLQLLERVFQSVSQELISLKNRSYSYANMNLAWKALQNGDRQQARYFQKQAIAFHPRLRYSTQCIRLNIAIAIIQFLGFDSFTKVLSLTYTLRKRVTSLIAQQP